MAYTQRAAMMNQIALMLSPRLSASTLTAHAPTPLSTIHKRRVSHCIAFLPPSTELTVGHPKEGITVRIDYRPPRTARTENRRSSGSRSTLSSPPKPTNHLVLKLVEVAVVADQVTS